jgi:hypothetical protein
LKASVFFKKKNTVLVFQNAPGYWHVFIAGQALYLTIVGLDPGRQGASTGDTRKSIAGPGVVITGRGKKVFGPLILCPDILFLLPTTQINRLLLNALSKSSLHLTLTNSLMFSVYVNHFTLTIR